MHFLPQSSDTVFAMIEKELLKIPRDKVREITKEHIEDIKNSNRRDFRF